MLDCKKGLFSLPDDVTYLNNAYMSPILNSTEQIGINALSKKLNPTNIGVDDFFHPVNKLRETFGKLIHAPAEQIALIPSVSYGISTVTKNLKSKVNGEIILIEEQFPSNFYPWEIYAQEHDQTLKIIKVDKSKEGWASYWNESILEAINDNTTVVSMAHVHWTDGTLFKLKEIREITKKHDAALVIDGTQSVGALPLFIDDIQVDALIVGGYKWLLGHYGLGLAYFAPSFNNGTPIDDNWINKKDSENFQKLVDYAVEYKEGAARYSMGEQSSFVLLPMLQDGLNHILEWGVENIQNYCRNLHNLLCNKLKDSPYQVSQPGASSSHLIGIRFDQTVDIPTVKRKLTEEKIFVSYRGDAMRISIHLYNDEVDIERFAKILVDCS